MKYLKLYKESDKSNYYVKIENYYQDMGNNVYRFVDLSDHHLYYLKILFNHYNIEVDHHDDFSFKNRTSINGVRYLKVWIGALTGMCDIRIEEIEDEYFLVVLNKADTYDSRYKCDQIDGVKELLIDKGVISA